MTAPYRYLIGIDPDPDLSPVQVRAFDEYYENVHRPEVVAGNPGFLSGHRLEAAGLAAGSMFGPAAGGGPRWLAFYAIADLASARDYVSRQRVPGAGMSYTPGPVPWTRTTTTWRAILAVTAGTADVTSQPGTVLLAATVPDPASDWPVTGFEVLEDLGARDRVPATLTATARPVTELGHPATWSRFYRRTGVQP